jgi:hypothetical protein
MTAKELDKLEKLAKAATPGPWAYEEISEPGFRAPADYEAKDFAITDENRMCPAIVWEHGDHGKNDAAYIAAAHPQTVLDLIAACRERDALLKVVEAAQAVYDSDPPVPYDLMDDSSFRVGRDEMLALEKALAQHRGETGGTDG